LLVLAVVAGARRGCWCSPWLLWPVAVTWSR